MKIRTILPVVALVTTLMSCNHSDTGDQLGDYFRRNDFAGIARMNAATFKIGGYTYISTGFTGTTNGLNSYVQETWMLDSAAGGGVNGGNWVQKANFPGVGRSQAVGFSDGKYGYVGTGVDVNTNYYSDFHLYDPTTNKWDTINNTTSFKVADLSTVAGANAQRCDAASFTINGTGYVGTGFNNNYLLDFYSYSFTGNSWTHISDLGHKTRGATTFTLNNLGYLIGGADGTGQSKYFWEYHPGTAGGTWVSKREIINATDSSFDDLYTSIQRQNAIALVLQSPLVNYQQVYLMQGLNGSALNSCWLWDPPTDQWTLQNPYPGQARYGAIPIQYGGRGFFATGGTGGSTVYDNVVEYLPGIALNTNDWQ
jgi:hypothetical protein